jgi:aspartyl-tRNA(Asn)/glutamyl-tRNA(Gln) amidotransferase subunit B
MAALLAEDRPVAEYFEAVVASSPETPSEKIANWLSGDFFALLNDAGIGIQQSKIPPAQFGRLVQMVEKGDVNATSAKVVLEEMFQSGGTPEEIVRAQSLEILRDPEAIQAVIQTILDDNPDQVKTYLEGKQGVLEWFFGQVMRITGGRADPSLVRQLLTDSLVDLEEGHLSGR